ncbi:hypothetical protein [Rhizobium sullae]|uniref:hypothetical protein n=1 Tax=Rhizobium sullae TaxID=50338 RepID=UPI001046E0AB|nr:hypothetical protein [Rhizobium sullae]
MRELAKPGPAFKGQAGAPDRLVLGLELYGNPGRVLSKPDPVVGISDEVENGIAAGHSPSRALCEKDILGTVDKRSQPGTIPTMSQNKKYSLSQVAPAGDLVTLSGIGLAFESDVRRDLPSHSARQFSSVMDKRNDRTYI